MTKRTVGFFMSSILLFSLIAGCVGTENIADERLYEKFQNEYDIKQALETLPYDRYRPSAY